MKDKNFPAVSLATAIARQSIAENGLEPTITRAKEDVELIIRAISKEQTKIVNV